MVRKPNSAKRNRCATPRFCLGLMSVTSRKSFSGFQGLGLINKFAFGELIFKGTWSKSDDDENDNRTTKSSALHAEPNLGQHGAEREKKSKAQLGRMRGRSASTAPGRFVAWCKQEQRVLQQQLEMMLAGKVLTGENRGSAGSTRPAIR